RSPSLRVDQREVSAHEPAGLANARLRRNSAADNVVLRLIESGSDLIAVIAGCHAAEVVTPEADSDEEADLVGGFIQDGQDWGEIWFELDMASRMRAEVAVTEGLRELQQKNFVVYCGRRQDTLEGGRGGPSPWLVAIIGVFRADDPRV